MRKGTLITANDGLIFYSRPLWRNLPGFFVVLFAIYDAFTPAKKINEGRVPLPGKVSFLWPVVILSIFLIIVAILFPGVLATGLESFSYYQIIFFYFL